MRKYRVLVAYQALPSFLEMPTAEVFTIEATDISNAMLEADQQLPPHREVDTITIVAL